MSLRHQPSIVKPYSLRSRASSAGGTSRSRTAEISQRSISQPSSSVGKYMHGVMRLTAKYEKKSCDAIFLRRGSTILVSRRHCHTHSMPPLVSWRFVDQASYSKLGIRAVSHEPADSAASSRVASSRDHAASLSIAVAKARPGLRKRTRGDARAPAPRRMMSMGHRYEMIDPYRYR